MTNSELNDIVENLERAADEIEDWGGYASEYFQEKYSLNETVEKVRTWAREFRKRCGEIVMTDELLILKLRSLIVDKEHANQMISADIAKFGEPQRDYKKWYEEIQKEIDEVFSSGRLK